MPKISLLFLCATLFCSCTSPTNLDIGNRFIDTFYSFNHDSLKLLTSSAEILYYQKWAECAHYKVLDRTHYFDKNDSTIVFPVTVKDDLMAALAIDFNVTDTFHITIRNKKIVSVTTSSNDLEEYYEAKEWVKNNRPELIEKACEGIWAGGPTPCDCVLGMIEGFKLFRENQRGHATSPAQVSPVSSDQKIE